MKGVNLLGKMAARFVHVLLIFLVFAGLVVQGQDAGDYIDEACMIIVRSTLIVSFSAGPNESIGSRTSQSEIEELKNITLTLFKEFISFSNLVKLDMAAVKGDLAALKGDLAAVKGDLAAVKGDLAAVKGDLAAVQNNLTSLWSELGRVGDQVEKTNGKVSTNKRLIKAQANTLDGVQNTLSGVQSTVSGVQNTVSGVQSAVDGVQNTVSGVQSAVDGVQNTVSGVQNTVDGVQNTVSGVQSAVSGVQNTVSGVQNTVSGVQSAVSGVQNTVDGVQSAVSGVQSTVDGVQNTVNGVESTVNGVESKLDGMELELVDQKGDMSANFNHTFALFNRLSSGQEVLYQNLSFEVKTDDLRIQEQLNSLQQVVETQVVEQGEVIASCCNQTSVQIDQLADRQETLYRNISADMSSLCLPPRNDPPTTSEPLTIASTATATEPPTDQGYTCGGTSGWRRVVFLNMTDPSHNCPSGWEETGYSKRTCGRATESAGTCDSATFQTGGLEYSRVCGRAVAYQFGSLSAFHRSSQTIESHYVNGLSLTHGSHGSRQHIWTFAGGVAEAETHYPLHQCPCDGGTSPVPGFLGNDYFCESGINGPWVWQYIIHPDDQLWDGRDCLPSSSCCSLNNPPYFIKEIGVNTNDDIEGRICSTYTDRRQNNTSTTRYSNTAIELLEIYVQ